MSGTVTYRLLDDRIRRFGQVADESRLQPADLVLLGLADAKASRLIEAAQRRGGFDSQHAQWTHVAMYIGDDRVIEATPADGVRVNALSDVMFRRPSLVRRVVHAELPLEARFRTIIHAMHEIGRPYSLGIVPGLGWRAWRRRVWRPGSGPDILGMTICSSLMRRAYLSGAELDIAPHATGVTWPADLSMSPRLADVPIGWVRVAR